MALRATGKVFLQGSHVLPQEWRTLRPVNRNPVVTDGPFSRANHQAGAFFFVETNDIDEATSAASKHAAANYAEHVGFAVEVRPRETFESAG